jgi:hypothetical protein
MVMHGRQRAVAPFHGRRGTLKRLRPLGGPRLPRFENPGGQLLGDRVRLQRALHRLQGLAHLGFPSRATCARGLVFPRDGREQALVHPPPPHGREDEGIHILLDALPPDVHQGGQGRQRLALGSRFNRLHLRLPWACDLCGGLGSRVRDTERMQRAREGLQVWAIRGVHLRPSLPLVSPRLHLSLGLCAVMRRLGPPLESRKGLRGFLERLVGLPQAPTNGQGRALDDLMDDVQDIRHAEAPHALFGKLDEGGGPLTDHVPALRAQRLESENDSLRRDAQEGRLGRLNASLYPFASSALSFPAILWHGRA